MSSTDKNTKEAATANSKQIALLKKHFANCFDKHGNFIADKLKEIVHDGGVAVSKESYSLNWLGKSYARLLANENIRTRLVADSAHNQHQANVNSQNLLIKGDNLDVLKHLVGAYSEQVKMIYIDPPYNTGSDGFVYQDDRKFTVEQLSSLAGIDEDESKRILEFTSSSSNSHSAWLTFMYPRLYIAKQLLSDEGVIFISIDDNEQAQLKVLCDEVFGEENFVANIIWNHTKQSKNDEPFFSRHYNQIMVYKRSEFLQKFKFERTEANNKNYANPDDDPQGDWRSGDVRSPSLRQTLKFKITTPSGGVILPPENGWRWSEKTILEKINSGEIVFAKNEEKIIRKIYLKDQAGRTPENLWLSDFAGTTRDATNELKALFGVTPFETPKPTQLIRKILELGANNGIILDFFAGSGTTAHAVMQLNAEDGGNRQCISVQIDEATDPKSEAYKAGYKTIFDITLARITKAAEKIKSENPACKADMGFKMFTTQPMFDKYLDTPDTLTENLELFDVKTLSQQDRHSLLLTWSVRDRIKLGANLTPVKLGGYTAYSAGKIIYFVEPDISLTAVVALLEQLDNNTAFAPNRLVVLGYLLDSKTQREMSEAVKGYNNRKNIELTLDIRYN